MKEGYYFFKRRKTMLEGKAIFTVTTVRHLTAVGGIRAVGFFHTFEEASECVAENAGDISEEGYYRFAVIEEVQPGIYVYPRNESWWAWDKEKEKYFPCEKPQQFKQVAGFGLG
jgi:hypothetical protein